MTTRAPFPRERKRYSAPLTNLAAGVGGEIACLDTATGKLNVVGTSTTLIPMGYFESDVTGDGTTPVEIVLFSKLDVHMFNNDSAPNALTVADRGSECYLKDGRTVSALSTGRSVAGIVLNIDSVLGVEVLFGLPVKGATGDSVGAAQSVADRTALAAIAAADRFDGMVVFLQDDGASYQFDSTATGTADENGMLMVTPGAGSGRWLRNDSAFVAHLAVDHSTADAAHLLTVPTGFRVKIADDPHYFNSVAFSGGTASAIGASLSIAAASTKGDLIGGAGGDVAAGLGTGLKLGTGGAKMDTIAHRRALVLVAADYIRFDRIVDNFTAGAGVLEVPLLVERV